MHLVTNYTKEWSEGSTQQTKVSKVLALHIKSVDAVIVVKLSQRTLRSTSLFFSKIIVSTVLPRTQQSASTAKIDGRL